MRVDKNRLKALRDNPELESVFVQEMERLKPITFLAALAFFDHYGDPSPFGMRRSPIVDLFEELYQSRIHIVMKGDPVEVLSGDERNNGLGI